jgi:hypothetical protein
MGLRSVPAALIIAGMSLAYHNNDVPENIFFIKYTRGIHKINAAADKRPYDEEV